MEPQSTPSVRRSFSLTAFLRRLAELLSRLKPLTAPAFVLAFVFVAASQGQFADSFSFCSTLTRLNSSCLFALFFTVTTALLCHSYLGKYGGVIAWSMSIAAFLVCCSLPGYGPVSLALTLYTFSAALCSSGLPRALRGIQKFFKDFRWTSSSAAESYKFFLSMFVLTLPLVLAVLTISLLGETVAVFLATEARELMDSTGILSSHDHRLEIYFFVWVVVWFGFTSIAFAGKELKQALFAPIQQWLTSNQFIHQKIVAQIVCLIGSALLLLFLPFEVKHMAMSTPVLLLWAACCWLIFLSVLQVWSFQSGLPITRFLILVAVFLSLERSDLPAPDLSPAGRHSKNGQRLVQKK
jgi:hypothetical protein